MAAFIGRGAPWDAGLSHILYEKHRLHDKKGVAVREQDEGAERYHDPDILASAPHCE